MPDPEFALLDHLRRRIQRAVQAGVLVSGSRLPSARSLHDELGVDHRAVLSAYRELTAEGVLEMRNRGGVYLAARPGADRGVPPLPESWMVELLAQGVARDIPVVELHEWLRRCVETRRLRAVAFESDDAHRVGLCRELEDDYGFAASAAEASVLDDDDHAASADVRRADLFVTTSRHQTIVQAAADRLGKPCVIATVSPDVIGGEWRMLLSAPLYVIVDQRSFGDVLTRFLSAIPGSDNLRVLVCGEDDLRMIPPNAPTYVTKRARLRLGDRAIPGRILPAPRFFSPAAARAILAVVVSANLDAITASA